MNPRQQEMLEIWTAREPVLLAGPPASLIWQMQQLASHDGTLHSRHQAQQFVDTLICWLINQNITDQQLFERLECIPDTISDEYRPWSPEYADPITNQEARGLPQVDPNYHTTPAMVQQVLATRAEYLALNRQIQANRLLTEYLGSMVLRAYLTTHHGDRLQLDATIEQVNDLGAALDAYTRAEDPDRERPDTLAGTVAAWLEPLLPR